MLKIEQMALFSLRWKYPRPIYDARSEITHSGILLLKLTDEDGCHGWGEMGCFGDVGDILIEVTERKIWPMISYRPLAPRFFFDEMHRETAHYGQKGLVISVLSGFEMALWDIQAKKAGMSVAAMLGGADVAIPAYASTGYYANTAAASANEHHWLEEQIAKVDLSCFSGVKIKTGRFDINDDIERVRIAREIIGDKKLLIADFNNACDFRRAKKFSQLAEAYDLHFIEEPLALGRVTQSKELKQASTIPIAGYELDCDYDASKKYIDQDAVDFIQPDCCWSGGITQCQKIADLAADKGIGIIPHNFAGPVSTAANAQLIRITKNSSLIEINESGSPLCSVASGISSLQLSAGKLNFSDKPGLGIEIDPERMREFLVNK